MKRKLPVLFLVLSFFLFANFLFLAGKFLWIFFITRTINKLVTYIQPDQVKEYLSHFDNLKRLLLIKNEIPAYAYENTNLSNYAFLLPYTKKEEKEGQSYRIEIHYAIHYDEILYFNGGISLFLVFHVYLLRIFLSKLDALRNKKERDYYLLFQLYDTFLNFHSKYPNFYIETIIEQFDRFLYKNREYSLGGDFLYLKRIELRNRNYIFFMNADAMGKSLKGLTGTLVLASILTAILKRTEKRYVEKTRFPETWLKYTSLEIQEVFENFEGFMMISCILGLIDEENYLMYHVNFDHPKMILYKNHEFQFLETKILKKLGFPTGNEVLEIHRYPLEPGDAIIIGSDGKDEVLIAGNFNEDENFSLKLLREAKGNLQEFYSLLKQVATIQDDVSLLKITVKGEENFALASFSRDFYEASLAYKQGIYSNTLKLLKDYVYNYPVDDTMLFLYVRSCRKLKMYEEAIEIGERLWNFNKNHIRNLLNLLYCYHMTNNLQRFETLCEEYMKYHKNSRVLIRIKKYFKFSL